MVNFQQRYRVLDRLESGGMAEVFRAESIGLQGFRKQVAIKRVLPELVKKKEFISMFLDEARLSANLNHSNCVQVFDIGVGKDTYFIAMEFVDGASLKTISEYMKKSSQTLPIAFAAWIGHEICKGLAYAHTLKNAEGSPLGIVHRDVSPPNILITKYGEVKIVDFGLAKANSQLERSQPGIIKGKYSYLSPEAAFGYTVDTRTDIFAVGIILWELLAGRRLFLGETDLQTVQKVQQAAVPPLSSLNHNVPPLFEQIIHRSLAKLPGDRYGTAEELGKDLCRFLFSYGTPVSSFDIAQLVQESVGTRKGARNKENSWINQLIQEVLLEFTSLPSQNSGAKNSLPPIQKGEHSSHSPLNALHNSRDDTLEGAVWTLSEKQPLPPPPFAAPTTTHLSTERPNLRNPFPIQPSSSRSARSPKWKMLLPLVWLVLGLITLVWTTFLISKS
ncbi:serine/threonine protein kinase [Pajaroellobacter abortibovis]|uniref:non-specific serine/threonine protein kinase n=1 Tax=Pajaroellobacter abortibovis TaxID=1882918 RepID=A0A1L6MVA5_9BACT|nr:serine/threonine-protein kinase [Pajaroellobacter abortibovis]APR99397.1 hypothetical protein BCY86_00910 [Pajaroellobacter abortibovis]